jgi:hypothetical protein
LPSCILGSDPLPASSDTNTRWHGGILSYGMGQHLSGANYAH